MIEQRKNQRFDLRLPFEILRDGAKTKVSGETMNVSSTGVLFSTENPVSIGEPIEYVITFPKVPKARNPVKLRCVGKVVREDQSAYAASLERYEFIRG
jgi:hypothetical protein